MKYRARYEQYAVLDEVMGSELVKELVVGRGEERRGGTKEVLVLYIEYCFEGGSYYVCITYLFV